MYEIFSHKAYLLIMYTLITLFLLLIAIVSMLSYVFHFIKSSKEAQNRPKKDERLELYAKITNYDLGEDAWHHAIEEFLVKFGVLKDESDFELFTQNYPKIVGHPVVKKKPNLLKQFIADLVKKNEAIHGKDFKKKLGLS